MEKRNKAYKFRLYPTALQAELLAKTFGCVRFVYNHYLAQKKDFYFFVSSEDEMYTDEAFLHHYRKMEKRLKKKQQTLSRRQKGSNRHNKQRLAVARLHEKVANQRRDYLHKLSRQIANAYDTVYVEDLNMQDMGKSLQFGKSVADNGWGIFLQFLKYKLEEQGKHLVKVDKWYASSKTCSVCGYKNKKLTLSMRTWECPVCHTIHDRDKNAAFNIKHEGIQIQIA